MSINTAETNSIPCGLIERTPCLSPEPTPNRTTKPRGNQVPRYEGDRDAPPTMQLCSQTTVDVVGVSLYDQQACLPPPATVP